MANTRGPRATRVSFLVPFVGIKQQLREGLPWKSIAVLALLMVASVILRCSGWCPACLTTGAPGRMLLVANLLMTFILLVPQGIPAELMLLFIGAVCSLAGILTSKELFQGCASDAVVTLALLFPIMKAMGDTGVPERFIGCMLGSAKGPYSLIIRMFFSVAILSGVFNNTPIVVMMIPLLQSLCLRQGVPSPAVLMPLSFAAQAGGSLTKMGSSINFVADEVFRANGYGIGFFTLTPGCIFICLLGGAYCAMMGPKVLMPVSDAVESSASRGGTNLFKVAFCPSEDGPLVGQTLEDLGLHRIPGVEEITLHRWHDVELVEAGVVDSNATAQSLQLEDSLYARCSAEGVAQLRRVRGLELCNDDELNLLGSKRRQRCLCEAAVKETLHGQRVSLRRFKRELRCAVVAVRSGAESVESEWREGFEGYEIQYGDVLLIEAFQEMFGSEPWLEHFSVTRRVPDSEPPRRGTKADDLRAIFIVVGLLIMIIIASGGKRAPSLPLMAVIFLCGIIAVKGLSLPEAYQEVNGPVLLTIVGALALGRAMELSGLANCLATALVALTRPLGAGAVKLGIYLATVGLGQFLNSAANVAIMGKIAIPIAHSMEIAVGEMALVVTYAASACYTAPYGYQTNTLVLRAGGYVWGDFVKFGGILQLLHMLLVVSMAGWWAKFSP